MYNWSTDTTKFKSVEQKIIWELEQMINFGLSGSRLNREKLKKYWNKLNLDPDRKRFLEFIIWNRKS